MKEFADSDVLLAVVGPEWLGPREGGPPRIADETDPVRVEVETALRRPMPIIPVLVHDATMPTADALPDSLKGFAFYNAAEVDAGRDFHPHVDRLIQSMDRVLKVTDGRWSGASHLARGVPLPRHAAVLIAGGVWLYLAGVGSSRQVVASAPPPPVPEVAVVQTPEISPQPPAPQQPGRPTPSPHMQPWRAHHRTAAVDFPALVREPQEGWLPAADDHPLRRRWDGAIRIPVGQGRRLRLAGALRLDRRRICRGRSTSSTSKAIGLPGSARTRSADSFATRASTRRGRDRGGGRGSASPPVNCEASSRNSAKDGFRPVHLYGYSAAGVANFAVLFEKGDDAVPPIKFDLDSFRLSEIHGGADETRLPRQGDQQLSRWRPGISRRAFGKSPPAAPWHSRIGASIPAYLTLLRQHGLSRLSAAFPVGVRLRQHGACELRCGRTSRSPPRQT